MRVERYADACQAVWDRFVTASRNGTFLFARDYMNYHRDRFDDHSLMVYDDRGELAAVCPANRRGDTLVSHGGLTYGGFVVDAAMKMPRLLAVFEAALAHLREQGVRRFVYKTIPHIYHQSPAEEDRYALFLLNARVLRRGVLTVIDARTRLPYQERRTRGVRKAAQLGLGVRETDEFAAYWDILAARLHEAHGTTPVHTLGEIEGLRARFPGNIRLFGCHADGRLVAGVVIYESRWVAHAQYIAADARGREACALDLLFNHLLTETYRDKPYFDFGAADEQDGRSLNRGLIDQKEGFGARVVVHDHYEIRVDESIPGQLEGAMA